MATKVWGSGGNIAWDDGAEGWTAGPTGRLWLPDDSFGRIGFDEQNAGSYYYGPVVDTGRTSNYVEVSDTPNPSGYTIEIRGSLASFLKTDLTPSWEIYTSGNKAWRYIQTRITYFTLSSSSSSSSSSGSSSSSSSTASASSSSSSSNSSSSSSSSTSSSSSLSSSSSSSISLSSSSSSVSNSSSSSSSQSISSSSSSSTSMSTSSSSSSSTSTSTSSSSSSSGLGGAFQWVDEDGYNFIDEGGYTWPNN